MLERQSGYSQLACVWSWLGQGAEQRTGQKLANPGTGTAPKASSVNSQDRLERAHAIRSLTVSLHVGREGTVRATAGLKALSKS